MSQMGEKVVMLSIYTAVVHVRSSIMEGARPWDVIYTIHALSAFPTPSVVGRVAVLKSRHSLSVRAAAAAVSVALASVMRS